MSLVGGKVIPKIIEVDPLAALDQGFGSWPVEAEMPNSGVIVDGLPTTDAWQERVHQNELSHFRGELSGIGVGDHQADVVPDDFSLLYAQRLREIVNADSRTLHVEAVARNVRVSDTGQVGRDYGEAPGQNRDDGLPHKGCLGISVQEYEWCAVARRQVVQFDATNLSGARYDCRISSLPVCIRKTSGEEKERGE